MFRVYINTQVSFDQSDGLFKIAPMLSEQLDPITHLAGLHILASCVYSRNRSQADMSGQLQEAGLYDAALTLLKTHSQLAGQGDSSTHRDTLEWFEASQVGSPMAPLPEDHPGRTFLPEEEAEGANGTPLATASLQVIQEDAEMMSGDVAIADQVVLAALEVLFKLSSSKEHLQAFR